MKESQVLNEGNPQCSHSHVHYIDNAFDGQAWWCDEPKCKRHERIDYSPEHKIKFPPHAFIRNFTNKFYCYQANDEGIVTGELPREKWIPYETLDSKL